MHHFQVPIKTMSYQWSSGQISRTDVFVHKPPARVHGGSKSDTSVGCAFVRGPTTLTFGLPAGDTIFSAELVAIHKALSFIEVSDDG